MQLPNFVELSTLSDADSVLLATKSTDNLGDEPSLPSFLHFIWIGEGPTLSTRRRIRGWAQLNPDCTVCLWSEAAMHGLANITSLTFIGDLMEAAPNPAALSDVGRFAILNRFGGIYLDTDMEACRPITPLLDYSPGFVVRESKWLLTASALGLPHDSLFGRVALRLMKETLVRRGSIDNFSTGPPLITELARAIRILRIGGPEVLPDWTFFPENPFRFPRGTRSPLPAYGIHLYDHSWAVGGELRLSRRLARSVLQLVLPGDSAIGKRRPVQVYLRRLAMVELSSAISTGS